MRRASLLPTASLFLVTAILVQSGEGAPQTNDTNRPAPAPRPASVIVRPAQQSQPDLLGSLIANAASFDMDSPVEAHAFFDPPTVSVGGEVSFRLTVTALDESLKVPDQLPTPPGLTLKAGGRSQRYEQVGMGSSKVRPETTIIFRGVATTNGTLTIPSFEVVAYSKPVKVPETTLKVTADNVAAAPEIPRLLVDMPSDDIYAGQTVRIPLILPMPPAGGVQSVSQPRVLGEFVFSEMPLIGMRQDTIRRDGKTFVAFVQDVLVTPLREGNQEIVAQAYCSMLRSAPGQPVSVQTLLVDSGPVTLKAKAVPTEGQLPGFTGAIGNFRIDPPRISTNQVRAGEPLLMTVTIRGDGNIGRLTPPTLPLLRDWQVFPPIGENLPAAIMQQRGFANFSYTLIPLNDQSKSTPAIPFSCFDPKKKEFVDLTIPPVHVTVTPAPAGSRAATEAAAPAVPEGEDAANREREPVLSGLAELPGGTTRSLAPIQQRNWFLGLQLVPAIAIVGLVFWDQRRRFLEEHPEVLLKRRARRGLRRALREARRAAAREDAAGFVNGATDALREACAPSGAANPSALVCADVLGELPATQRKDRSGEVVRRLFAAADALRFGGALNDGKDLLSLRPQFERVLSDLKEKL